MEVPKSVISCLLAVDDLLAMLPRLYAKRDRIQAMRKRDDSEIMPLFRTPLSANFGDYYPYTVMVEQIVKHFDIPAMFDGVKTTRLLILSSDPMRPELAGTGIRVTEMAQACSASTARSRWRPTTRPITRSRACRCFAFDYDEPELVERLVESADVVLLQGFLVTSFPFLNAINKIVIVDMYDPFPLSNLEFTRVRPPEDASASSTASICMVLRYLLGLGDFFLCASEEQRAYWLGALTAAEPAQPRGLCRRPDAAAADRPGAVRPVERAAAAHAAAAQRRPSRHRPGRYRAAVGRRDLGMVRPADAAAGDGDRRARAAGYQAVLPRPRPPEHPRCARDADVRSHGGAGR